MGAIVYQKDSGLNQGLDILGQALGEAIHRRGLQNRFKQINESIKDKPVTTTTLQGILAEPGGAEYLQQMAPFIAPLLKEQAKREGANDWLKSMSSMLAGGEAEDEGDNGSILEGVTGKAPVSPIAEARSIQNNKSVPGITAPEAATGTNNNQAISGVPNAPTPLQVNAKAPVEQTEFQQSGKEGMGLNPPSETNAPTAPLKAGIAQMKKPEALPGTTGPAGLSNQQMLMMAGSPYQEHREFAKAALQMQSGRDKLNFQMNKPFYEEMGKLRVSLPDKEMALERVDTALESGDINQFTDWAAGKLGLDPMKTTQAQILEAAVKTFFLGDLSTLKGGRINQLLEKNLLFALQNPGKSPAANQEITEALHATVDMQKAKLQEYDHITKQYRAIGMLPPSGLDEMVDERLSKFNKKRMNEFETVAKEIRGGKITNNSAVSMRRAVRETRGKPPKEGTVWMLFPKGEVAAIPTEDLSDAVKTGKGRIIEQEPVSD